MSISRLLWGSPRYADAPTGSRTTSSTECSSWCPGGSSIAQLYRSGDCRCTSQFSLSNSGGWLVCWVPWTAGGVLGNPQAPDMHVLMPKNGNIQRFSANQNTRKPKIRDTSFQVICYLLDVNRSVCCRSGADTLVGATSTGEPTARPRASNSHCLQLPAGYWYRCADYGLGYTVCPKVPKAAYGRNQMEGRAAVASARPGYTATTERDPPTHSKICVRNAHKLRHKAL